MIGIDTNILVRFYIQDNQEQHKKVVQLFSKASVENPLYINIIVLIEWYWVLAQIYKVSKQDIIRELNFLLASPEIVLENSVQVRKSLETVQIKNADFADSLIALLNDSKNCETTYTFDKNASKLNSFSLLS